jgi:hypothetical protein
LSERAKYLLIAAYETVNTLHCQLLFYQCKLIWMKYHWTDLLISPELGGAWEVEFGDLCKIINFMIMRKSLKAFAHLIWWMEVIFDCIPWQWQPTYWNEPEDLQQSRGLASGLPDFSWYIIPKLGKTNINPKIYQMAIKHTRWPLSRQNGHKIYQHLPLCTRPSEIYPKYDFWSQNIPSGNPDWHYDHEKIFSPMIKGRIFQLTP